MLAPAGIPSSGMMRYALSPMVAYKYLATPEERLGNRYFITIFRIGAWCRTTAQHSHSLKGYLRANRCRGGAWMVPILTWSAYVLVVYFVMICLSVLPPQTVGRV